MTLVQGTNLSDFQYAGMYAHQLSGLYLTLSRAYDPNTARWLSRDPLGEGTDATLYSYLGNDTLNRIDFFGLAWESTPTQGPHCNDRQSDFGFGLSPSPNGKTLIPTPLKGHSFNSIEANSILQKALNEPCDYDKIGSLIKSTVGNPAYKDQVRFQNLLNAFEKIPTPTPPRPGFWEGLLERIEEDPFLGGEGGEE